MINNKIIENRRRSQEKAIKVIKLYFDNQAKKNDYEKIIKFEVIRDISKFNNEQLTFIQIITDVEKSMNPFLKYSYFIVLSKYGKIKDISVFRTFKDFKDNSLKSLLNKHYLGKNANWYLSNNENNDNENNDYKNKFGDGVKQ